MKNPFSKFAKLAANRLQFQKRCAKLQRKRRPESIFDAWDKKQRRKVSPLALL
jgi:hypothetical protein